MWQSTALTTAPRRYSKAESETGSQIYWRLPAKLRLVKEPSRFFYDIRVQASLHASQSTDKLVERRTYAHFIPVLQDMRQGSKSLLFS